MVRDDEACPGRKRQDWDGGPMIEKLYDKRHDVTRDMMQLLSASVSSAAEETQWLPFLLERTQRVK